MTKIRTYLNGSGWTYSTTGVKAALQITNTIWLLW